MNGVISGDTLIGIITTDETLTGVLTNPKNIDLSDDTITPEDLRNGIKAHNSSGAQITGSMVDNGAVIKTINTKDEEYTINEGYHNGNGKVSIDSIEQEKIIPGNIKKDISILGVTGTLEASDIDWSVIGYSGEPEEIQNNYDYAVNIKNNWTLASNLQYKFRSSLMKFMPLVDTSTATSMFGMFQYCYGLISVPLLNTSKVTTMGSMFQYCYSLESIPPMDTSNVVIMGNMFQNCVSLKNVPILNTNKATNLNNMFEYCENLSNESLDNILQMCIGANSYTSTKTLNQIGIKKSIYPATRIQALPHYQAFINAGWTIGY